MYLMRFLEVTLDTYQDTSGYMYLGLFISPRLLEGGRRNEGARGRCVTAGGAARAPDELETREANRSLHVPNSCLDVYV